jgi:hypothetical protein
MTNLDFKKLVNKYAVILIISYGITFLIGIILQRISPETIGLEKEMHIFLMSSTWIFQFFINVIVALIVINDSKKLEMKNNLIIVATILFLLVGVCMFLILANREITKSSR